MKIINVSADLNSQNNIRQQNHACMGRQAKEEISKIMDNETSEGTQMYQKKGRKTKRTQS